MITLAPFYKRINLAQEGQALAENLDAIDYERCLEMLRETFRLTNPDGRFMVCTDEVTQLPFDKRELFREPMADRNLMASLVRSNTAYVEKFPGKTVLCGADHLIVDRLDVLFEDEFDIALMIRADSVNNTAVMINTNQKNHERVVEFFQRREQLLDTIKSKHRVWLGDQVSLRAALTDYGFDRFGKDLIGRVIESKGMRIKFMEYNSGYIWGVKKTAPNYAPDAVFVDFKGAERKRWLEPVYQKVLKNINKMNKRRRKEHELENTDTSTDLL